MEQFLKPYRKLSILNIIVICGDLKVTYFNGLLLINLVDFIFLLFNLKALTIKSSAICDFELKGLPVAKIDDLPTNKKFFSA